MTEETLTPAPPTAPRPGIAHLLLWTAGSALLLLFFRRADASYDFPENWQVFRQVLQIPQCMMYGAALASFSLYYFYRRVGVSYPRHPGHWLLLRMGLGVSAAWILFELLPQVDYESFEIGRIRAITFRGVETGLDLLVFLSAAVALFRKRDVIWAVVFLAAVPLSLLNVVVWLLILGLLPGFRSFDRPDLFDFGLVKATLPQLGVLAARVIDFLTGTRRDWAHFVGVWCFLLITVVAWTWHIWTTLKPWTP